MSSEVKLFICALASAMGHLALARALNHLPPRVDLVPTKIEVRVIEAPPPVPPPPPELEKLAEPDPTPPPPKPIEHPQTVRPHAVPTAAVAQQVPADHPAVTGDTTGDSPVFGISMESTSAVGGPAIPVGNTARPEVGAGSAAPVPRGAPGPVADYETTKLPLPQGRCSGKYTDEARAAGIEGTVVLDLVVSAEGRVSDIKVVTGLGHGLDQAAIAALRDCRFTPGEQAGKPVAVRVRGFKIRFVMESEL